MSIKGRKGAAGLRRRSQVVAPYHQLHASEHANTHTHESQSSQNILLATSRAQLFAPLDIALRCRGSWNVAHALRTLSALARCTRQHFHLPHDQRVRALQLLMGSFHFITTFWNAGWMRQPFLVALIGGSSKLKLKLKYF